MNINQLSNEKIFKILSNSFQNYLLNFHLNYSIVDKKFNERKVKPENQSYDILFENFDLTIKITFSLVSYASSNSSSIFIWIDSNSQKGIINLTEYFVRYKQINLANNYFVIEGNQIDLVDKLNVFFKWLISVTDAQLINILQGKDWVEIPFDWGDYK